MFDLLYGLRRSAKSQLVLLVLGFSVFGAMLTFCVAVGPKLFQLHPSWVKQQATFASVGVQGQDNELGKTSLKQLSEFRNAVGVEDLATLGLLKNVQSRLLENDFKVTAAIVSDNFAGMLKAQELTTDQTEWSEVVYLSHKFWTDTLNRQMDLVGQTLYLPAADIQLRVAGILPVEYDEFMPEQPQIWLSNSHAAALVSINFGDSEPPASFVETLRAQIANEDTVHVGFLLISPGMTADDIVSTKQTSLDDEDSFIHTENAFSAIKAIPGIEMTPLAKQQLRFQWWLILFLSFALGLVNALNFFTTSVTQLVERQQEMNVRVAVGATLPHLIKTLLFEQLPLLFMAATGTALLTTYSLTLLDVYNDQFVKVAPESLFFGWLVTVLLLAITICLIISVALLQIHKMQIFQRGKAEQRSKLQQHLGEFTIFMQLTLAGLALCFSTALMIEQWQKFNKLPFNADLAEIKITVADKAQEGSAIDVTYLQELLPQQLTYSERSFVLPNALSFQLTLDGGANGGGTGVNLIAVSPNYFERLATPMFSGVGFNGKSIVINRATAMLLRPDAPFSLVGQTIQSSQKSLLDLSEEEPIRISAVVANLPHYGVINASTPMIYINSILPSKTNLRQVHLIFDIDQKQLISDTVSRFSTEQGGVKVEYMGPIKQQLAAENSVMQKLIFLALLFAILICSLAAYSLFQQLSSHLKLLENRYGIMLAVGAQPSVLILQIWRNLGIALILSVIPIFALLKWSNSWVTEQLQLSVLNWTAVGVSLALMLLLCILSSLVPCQRLMRRPVSSLLYAQD